MNIKATSVKILSFLNSLKVRIQNNFTGLTFPDYTIFSVFAVIIGAVTGITAVFFHHSIDFFNKLFFETTAEGLFFLGAAAVIVIPAIGMLIQSIMIIASPKTASKRGVSEVIKAVALRGGLIPLKTTIFHFLAPVISIGSGNTVGPEGPAAQIGGGVASKFGNLVRLSDSRRRIFTAAGAGAAISAIFNTPLGGVFFALEIILLNEFHTATFSALILASVTASAISRALIGNDSIFIFDSVGSIEYGDLWLFAVLGIFIGIASILFIRYSSALEKLIKNKIYSKNFPQWLLMILVGLIVGVAGYFYKEIFGIGYKAINEILSNSLSWQIVLILLGLKFILVPLVLHAGGFGGIFAPSLFMGACFGYLFAFFANSLWGIDLDYTTFTLVGMGAMLGGINTIPITAIMIIFEMTQDYTFILPLMLAVIMSTTIVKLVYKKSIHTKHLEEQGYQIIEGRETNQLKSITLRDIKLEKIDLIPTETSLPQLVAKMIESPNSTFYTVDKTGKLTGMITETEIRPIITEYDHLKSVIVAGDIAKPGIVTVNTTDNLDYVLKLFGKWNVDQFPVIDSLHNSKIVGSVTRQDVLSIYNRESLKLDLAEGIGTELKTITQQGFTKISGGHIITECEVPDSYFGKSLKELQLRNKFGIEVLMIKHLKNIFEDEGEHKPEIITPDPNYKLRRDDRLIIFGKEDEIAKFKN